MAPRAIQLGLKKVEKFLNGEMIAHIEDITEFVTEQHRIVSSGSKEFTVPVERIYFPTNEKAGRRVGIESKN